MTGKRDGEKGTSVTEEGERGFQVPYREILRHETEDARREFERLRLGLFMSSLSAGLDIAFGPLLMAFFLTLGPANPEDPPPDSSWPCSIRSASWSW